MKPGLFSKIRFTLRSISLLVGILLLITHMPGSAASPDEVGSSEPLAPRQASTCTPPNDWGETVRLHTTGRTSMAWTFEVDEPAMDVTLEFFYYQDYDLVGCPYDCSTGPCQLDEVGAGESPLGEFRIEDGKEGAEAGVIQQVGRLEEGIYQASFQITARGSINIGLRVQKLPVPTATPEQEITQTPVSEATPTEIEPTATSTATATDSPPTATPTETSLPPTPTPTDQVLSLTPTRTSRSPATLPPPTLLPGMTQTPALIPVTGADFTSGSAQPELYRDLLINLGIGILGLGFILRGIYNRRKNDQG